MSTFSAAAVSGLPDGVPTPGAAASSGLPDWLQAPGAAAMSGLPGGLRPPGAAAVSGLPDGVRAPGAAASSGLPDWLQAPSVVAVSGLPDGVRVPDSAASSGLPDGLQAPGAAAMSELPDGVPTPGAAAKSGLPDEAAIPGATAMAGLPDVAGTSDAATDSRLAEAEPAVWRPDPVAVRGTRIVRFAQWLVDQGRAPLDDVSDYRALHAWSVSEPGDFWAAVAEFFAVDWDAQPRTALAERTMPGTDWFPGGTLNFGHHLVRAGADDQNAVVLVGEGGVRETLTYAQLREQSAAVAGHLRALGVEPGDRVAAYLPNCIEGVVAFVATAMVGAVWAQTGLDYAAPSAAERMAQLSPRILFAGTGYRFGGKVHDRRAEARKLRTLLPGLEHTITIETAGLSATDNAGAARVSDTVTAGTAGMSATDNAQTVHVSDPLTAVTANAEANVAPNPVSDANTAATDGLSDAVTHGVTGLSGPRSVGSAAVSSTDNRGIAGVSDTVNAATARLSVTDDADAAHVSKTVAVGSAGLSVTDNAEAAHVGDTSGTWAEALAGEPVRGSLSVGFGHPLWVLFTSGTTGKPKGIVHGHGGVLLEQLVSPGLHMDLRASDVFFWYTTPNWMMWNAQVCGLLHGATIVLYDGRPTSPGTDALWRIVVDESVTVFGTSPGYLEASQKAGLEPGAGELRMVGVTGSVLPAGSNAWFRAAVSDRVQLGSMSGGTDICGIFVSSAPNTPVFDGEISAPALGAAVEVWTVDGQPAADGEAGEMVITAPMPSMPLRFWDDADGTKLRETYFETFPGVWRHGDLIERTTRGTYVIHGRSDATINRHGVRLGSAEIYAAVADLPEVVDALVVGVEEPGGGYWMPLFLVTKNDLDVEKVRQVIAERASRRHVPDEVIVVAGLPHTRTGKRLEVPVKRILQGADPARVIDRGAVDDSAALDALIEVARARRGALQHRGTERAGKL
ncbi:AMP-binding protein [Actinoplanes bogorensis]|uniref:AMP-binding protein n=1 Tax=Paractinoplanes bogorensis TaxID=1610840 RepID=A0ABS5YJU9_9ACTN|nr:AMP-binding protein [Actinoplanes bogorensis]MBU2663761.1 AMP-binding protein [Actinoplanes bogorensis]